MSYLIFMSVYGVVVCVSSMCVSVGPLVAMLDDTCVVYQTFLIIEFWKKSITDLLLVNQ